MVEITKHPNPQTGYHDIVVVVTGCTFQSAMCDLSVLEFIISMQTSAGWEYMLYTGS